MRNAIKRGPLLLAAALSVCAVMAVTASAASAANAWWVNPATVSATGSLTLKQAGANEKTCTPALGISGTASTLEGGGFKGGVLILKDVPGEKLEYNCTGSTRLALQFGSSTSYESGYWVNVQQFTGNQSSPYGTYSPQVAMKLPWTNGAESTDSSFAFSNTKIGSNAGGEITATGTVTVKRSGGGILTLTH